jgi:hypothetical protein
MLIIVTRPAGWFMPCARVRISSARALRRFMLSGMADIVRSRTCKRYSGKPGFDSRENPRKELSYTIAKGVTPARLHDSLKHR